MKKMIRSSESTTISYEDYLNELKPIINRDTVALLEDAYVDTDKECLTFKFKYRFNRFEINLDYTDLNLKADQDALYIAELVEKKEDEIDYWA